MARYLEEADLLRIHNELVKVFEQEGDPISPSGKRNDTLLGSAAGRPRTSLGGVEKYASIQAKAAALLHSLVKNHPFHNGNKRTALVAMLVFLTQNNQRVEATDQELFDLVIGVAEGTLGAAGGIAGDSDSAVDAIRLWVSKHTHALAAKPSAMDADDFCRQVDNLGGRTTRSGGSVNVRGPNGRCITISASTKRLDGKVVKSYLSTLGLSQGKSGLHVDEFQAGVDPSQAFIARYRDVLRKLAQA